MHHRVITLAAALIVLLPAGCTSVPSPSASQMPAGQPSSTSTTIRNAEGAALEKGMTAETVRRLWSEPAEIQPYAPLKAYAEVWTYRRTVSDRASFVLAGTQSVSMALGQTVQMVDQPVKRLEHRTIIEETSLLMFEGRLLEWKQKVYEERRIDN
jgi:hypothetical protein